ncbi:MAG: histone deacetylase [Armatimonadota bacterium]|nr:histone deacetylase [Armatimonadota bacterium]
MARTAFESNNRRDFIKTVGGALVTALVAPAALASKPRLPTALIYDARYKQHQTGEGHPESPVRCDAIINALRRAGLEKQLLAMAPRAAVESEILGVHEAGYWRTVQRDIAAVKQSQRVDSLSTGDTSVGPSSLEIALLAAGGVLSAVDAVIAARVANAFCLVRPPGHHATPSRGMGFCIFNNIAIAARYAQKKHKIGKVLIVDWEVHHGNGTQDTFYEDGSVFYFSTHQSPWYPGTGVADETGSGRGKGTTLNCPFPAGAGRKEILGAFQDKLVPAVRAFKPDLVLISSGFDSRLGDPLGRFELTDEDFADLTALMLDIAREHAQGRLISVLEGGYNLDGLGRAATSHLQALRTGRVPA